MFRRSYIQKVLCSENSLFDVGKNLHLSVSGKLLQCKMNKSQPLFLAYWVKGQMSFCHGALTSVKVKLWQEDEHHLIIH